MAELQLQSNCHIPMRLNVFNRLCWGLQSCFGFSHLWAGRLGWGTGTPRSSRWRGAQEGRDLWPDTSSSQPIVANRSAMGAIRNGLSDIQTQVKKKTLKTLKHLWVCVGRGHASPWICVPDSQHAIFPSPPGGDHLSLPWTPSHCLNTYRQWSLAAWLFKQTTLWIAAWSTNSIF